jgi:alkanesulfonate monooxygenase SsuD/methylene tetrahydromethanopterin reductase-like flavin-dependent oxidoreductase (luciferase family)
MHVAPKHAFWIRNGQHGPDRVLELAVEAEAAGWDGVFLSDAVMEGHTEPFTQLAAIAARTQSITLGTWVVPLVARDVVAVARGAAVVDALSGGRLLLGLGLGNTVEHDALGVRRRGGPLGAGYDAALEVLAALLEGETVTRHDDWFDLAGVALNARPVRQPRPPMLLAAAWPATRPVERAARWDGCMPVWPAVYAAADDEGALESELRELLAHYRGEGVDGVVVVPRFARFGSTYDELLVELGVDWALTCDDLDLDAVRAGPPV